MLSVGSGLGYPDLLLQLVTAAASHRVLGPAAAIRGLKDARAITVPRGCLRGWPLPALAACLRTMQLTSLSVQASAREESPHQAPLPAMGAALQEHPFTFFG